MALCNPPRHYTTERVADEHIASIEFPQHSDNVTAVRKPRMSWRLGGTLGPRKSRRTITTMLDFLRKPFLAFAAGSVKKCNRSPRCLDRQFRRAVWIACAEPYCRSKNKNGHKGTKFTKGSIVLTCI